MKTRTIATGVVVFALGVFIVAAGITFGLSYDRAVHSAAESYRAGKSFDAISTLKSVVDLPMSDPRARYNLGIAFMDMSTYEDATGEFRKLAGLTDDPKLQSRAYYMVAWSIVMTVDEKIKESNGRYSSNTESAQYGQALRYLAEAMRLDPSNEGAKNLYERITHLFRNQPPEDQESKPMPGLKPDPQWEEPKP